MKSRVQPQRGSARERLPESGKSLSFSPEILGTPAASSQGAAKRSPGLGNTPIAFPEPSKRSQRWDMRDGLRKFTRLSRVRKCGVVPVMSTVSLRCDHSGARAGYGGLSTCGSVWACPVCAAKIASRRKADVEEVLDHALRQGLHVSMLTLTQRHHSGQRLAVLWDALSYAWNGVTSGRRWIEFKEQLGLVGYIKAVEVTHGANGWHVHTHVLVISEKDPTVTPVFFQRKQGLRKTPYPIEVQTSAEFVADRWARRLAKRGVDFVADKGGLDWETAKDAKAIGNYVAKLQTGADSLSAEATLGGFKKARRGNRTPFQILADIIETGDADDIDIWYEYEKASKGKRALTWSKGLRNWANLGQELTDEEIAEEEVGDKSVALFNHEQWKDLRKAGPAQLLDVCQDQGITAALDWLDRHGIGWSPPLVSAPDE